ncbi:hypothetical protein BC831DRAFT_447526 [Entophlyctis helioformis]|nr:hypothetical protein BC831DRAFT_447526 [Entophlyctis helioformis]
MTPDTNRWSEPEAKVGARPQSHAQRLPPPPPPPQHQHQYQYQQRHHQQQQQQQRQQQQQPKGGRVRNSSQNQRADGLHQQRQHYSAQHIQLLAQRMSSRLQQAHAALVLSRKACPPTSLAASCASVSTARSIDPFAQAHLGCHSGDTARAHLASRLTHHATESTTDGREDQPMAICMIAAMARFESRCHRPAVPEIAAAANGRPSCVPHDRPIWDCPPTLSSEQRPSCASPCVPCPLPALISRPSQPSVVQVAQLPESVHHRPSLPSLCTMFPLSDHGGRIPGTLCTSPRAFKIASTPQPSSSRSLPPPLPEQPMHDPTSTYAVAAYLSAPSAASTAAPAQSTPIEISQYSHAHARTHRHADSLAPVQAYTAPAVASTTASLTASSSSSAPLTGSYHLLVGPASKHRHATPDCSRTVMPQSRLSASIPSHDAPLPLSVASMHGRPACSHAALSCKPLPMPAMALTPSLSPSDRSVPVPLSSSLALALASAALPSTSLLASTRLSTEGPHQRKVARIGMDSDVPATRPRHGQGYSDGRVAVVAPYAAHITSRAHQRLPCASSLVLASDDRSSAAPYAHRASRLATSDTLPPAPMSTDQTPPSPAVSAITAASERRARRQRTVARDCTLESFQPGCHPDWMCTDPFLSDL